MEGYITVLHLFVYFVIVGAVVSARAVVEPVVPSRCGIRRIDGRIRAVTVSTFLPDKQPERSAR